MQRASYFDFVNDRAIRIKGHRIGIEHVLRDYRNGARTDELLRRYPTLTCDEIQSTIRYYLANRDEVDEYMCRVKELLERDWREQARNPPDFIIESRKKLDECRKTFRAQTRIYSFLTRHANSRSWRRPDTRASETVSRRRSP